MFLTFGTPSAKQEFHEITMKEGSQNINNMNIKENSQHKEGHGGRCNALIIFLKQQQQQQQRLQPYPNNLKIDFVGEKSKHLDRITKYRTIYQYEEIAGPNMIPCLITEYGK